MPISYALLTLVRFSPLNKQHLKSTRRNRKYFSICSGKNICKYVSIQILPKVYNSHFLHEYFCTVLPKCSMQCHVFAGLGEISFQLLSLLDMHHFLCEVGSKCLLLQSVSSHPLKSPHLKHQKSSLKCNQFANQLHCISTET